MIAGSYRILLTYLVSRMGQLNTLSKAVHSLKLNTLKVTEKSSNNLCPFTLWTQKVVHGQSDVLSMDIHMKRIILIQTPKEFQQKQA